VIVVRLDSKSFLTKIDVICPNWDLFCNDSASSSLKDLAIQSGHCVAASLKVRSWHGFQLERASVLERTGARSNSKPSMWRGRRAAFRNSSPSCIFYPRRPAVIRVRGRTRGCVSGRVAGDPGCALLAPLLQHPLPSRVARSAGGCPSAMPCLFPACSTQNRNGTKTLRCAKESARYLR
jgi:hypothetical protein